MEELTYEKAIRQLEEIVSKIESGTLDVDQLASRLKEAKEYIAYCQSVLKKVGEDVEKVLEE